MELQVLALEPYPLPGHSKQSFVARWKGTEYTANVLPIFQEKVNNLRGNKLIACVFEFPPLVIKTEVSPGKFVYSGQEVEIFKEFAKILNFTYEFYEPPEGEKWGTAVRTSLNFQVQRIFETLLMFFYGSWDQITGLGLLERLKEKRILDLQVFFCSIIENL